MARFKLTIAYDGTEFHGWQRQEPPNETPLRTVQGVLAEAVRICVGAPVSVLGASRTDAGVHALGQVAAFTAETRIPIERLPLAIGARLPEDVQVLDACVVDEAFDPISDARSKSYRYSIAFPVADATQVPLFERRYVFWQVHDLDVAAMQAAAQRVVGEHDFAAFAHVAHGRESTIRRIHACSVLTPRAGRVWIDVAGGGFLYNMVRIVAGTLLEVGRGRMTADDVSEALASKDRTRAGPTMPPQGLCLRWIHYGECT